MNKILLTSFATHVHVIRLFLELSLVQVILIFSAYSFITLSVAFPALVLLGILRNVLWNMPLYLSAYLDAGVAAKRIRQFLDAPEVESTVAAAPVHRAGQALEQIRLDIHMATEFAAVSIDRSLPIGMIRIANSNFSWSGAESSDAFSLTDISLECAKGQLTAVVGQVGSGKSSLVMAVLGEMPASAGGGACKLNGRVAYVPQSAFILNATCKENILFGAPFDRERYDAVVTASELRADFKELVHGV